MDQEQKESNKRKCKVCGDLRDRIQDGYYPGGRNKKWRDELGQQWNGNVCGSCNVKRAFVYVSRKKNHNPFDKG